MTVTLAQLKEWLRVEPEDGEQDAALGLALSSAQGWVERRTALYLTRREVTQPVKSFDGGFQAIYGPNPELITITYVGSDDAPGEITDARVVITGRNGRGTIYPALGERWPWGREILASYTAGYADPDEIDAALLLAVIVHATASVEYRDGAWPDETWKALDAILEDYTGGPV